MGGEWRTIAPMPTARGEIGIGAVDGELYAVGGANGGSTAFPSFSTTEAYDIATESWVQRNPLPVSRTSVASSVHDGQIYIFGGRGHVDTTYRYDHHTGVWSSGRSMPTGRAYPVAGVISGKVYVVGGSRDSRDQNEEYDPITDLWAFRAPRPTSGSAPGAGVIGGRMHVAGGFLSTNRTEHHAYDPVTDTWSTHTPLPQGAAGAAAEAYGGKLYIFSYVPEPDGFHVAWNRATDTWEAIAAPSDVRAHWRAALHERKIYVVGGYNSATNEEYTPPAPEGILDGTSLTITSGDGLLKVVHHLAGTSSTESSGQADLKTREHLSGVSLFVTGGHGRPRTLLNLSGVSVSSWMSTGTMVIPLGVSGTSTTAAAGVGELTAPVPVPLEGHSLAATDGGGSAVLLVNLRGPSMVRSIGRGALHLEDTTGEFAEADALVRRLPDTYAKQDGSRIFRLFRIIGHELAQIRQALETAERMRDIDQASGATLEGIGSNVRQPRGQLGDRAYRALIKAKIARHLSPGDVGSIKDVVAAMLDITPGDVGVRQLWMADPPEPAAVEITAPMDALAQFQLTPTQFVAIMQRVVAAGVRVPALLGGTFELSEEFETDDTERGLADDAMTFGGTLGEYYDAGDDAELPLGE